MQRLAVPDPATATTSNDYLDPLIVVTGGSSQMRLAAAFGRAGLVCLVIVVGAARKRRLSYRQLGNVDSTSLCFLMRCPSFCRSESQISCCRGDPRDFVVAKDCCDPAIEPSSPRSPVRCLSTGSAPVARKALSIGGGPSSLPSAPTCRFGQLRFAARCGGRADGCDGPGWR